MAYMDPDIQDILGCQCHLLSIRYTCLAHACHVDPFLLEGERGDKLLSPVVHACGSGMFWTRILFQRPHVYFRSEK